MSFAEHLFDKYCIDDLIEPSDNSTVFMKRYWIVHEGSVLKYKQTNAWQCNSLKMIVDAVVETNPIYEGCEIVFFEYLYLPR